MSETTTTTGPESHAAAEDAVEHHHDHGMAHVMPLPILFAVFVALIILTVVTVLAADAGLGEIDIWVSLAIATLKAALVAVFFMHLRYDKPLNALVFVSSLVFLMLFLGFALMDSATYQPSIEAYDATQEQLAGGEENEAAAAAEAAESAEHTDESVDLTGEDTDSPENPDKAPKEITEGVPTGALPPKE